MADDGLTASGTWSVNSGAAQNTSSSGSTQFLYAGVNDDDLEYRYAYTLDSSTAGTPVVDTQFRYNPTSGVYILVRFHASKARLYKYDGTALTNVADNSSVTTTTGVKYNVRVEADGATVKMWRAPASGGPETLVFNQTSMPTYDGSRVRLLAQANTVISYDDIIILASDSGLSRSTTFTAALNNELATMANYNGSTSYAFDDWGRLSTETRGSVTKTYGWTKANLLASVDSSASGDANVSYTYTGDLKRAWRSENGSVKQSYKWDAGFNVSEEYDYGTSKTYAGGLAEVDVTSTPAYSYLTHDHLGSTRGMWDGSIAQTAAWEDTPPLRSPPALQRRRDDHSVFVPHPVEKSSIAGSASRVLGTPQWPYR